MTNGPHSVGIIMDGNRRWAKEKGLAAWEGHEAGKNRLFSLLDEYKSLRDAYGTSHYIFYAFSTENWKRSPIEVQKLLALVEDSFAEMRKRLAVAMEEGVRVRFIGDISKFSKKIQEQFADLEQKTKGNTKGTIAFAFSYGGRDEILRATKRLVESGANLEKLSEEQFAEALDTNGIPDPDLIIRTGGAMRLSNFLPWQSAYSELAFTPVYWPDFTREELEKQFLLFAETKRNFGT